MVAGVLILALAALASLFMAWAIGAGSSGSTPFAPAVGAGAISTMQGAFFVGLLGLAGALLQGASVTEAVGNELVIGASLTPVAALFVLATAAGLVALGVFRGYPLATAFVVTGAVIGAGLALGGEPNWAKYQEIGGLWLFTPLVGGGASYATARLLRDENVPERVVIPGLAALVAVIVANIPFLLLGNGPQGASMASAAVAQVGLPALGGRIGVTVVVAALVAWVVAIDMNEDSPRAQRRFLLILGALVAFSAGGSQVGLAIGPLLPLLDQWAIPMGVLLAAGGLGLLAGSWTGAPRMIKALSRDYSSLGPRRSIAALIPAFAIAQIAVAWGVPVSFNEIIVSGIVGSGFAAGVGGVSARKIGGTLLAWLGSFVLAILLGYGGASLLSGIA